MSPAPALHLESQKIKPLLVCLCVCVCIEAVKAAPGWLERFCPTSAPPSRPHPRGAGGADAAPASPASWI